MNTAEKLIAELEQLGVSHVFGYPGGRVIELFSELSESDITVVRPRDEREASVMAELYGRLHGKPGVLTGQGPWIGSLGAIGQMEAQLGSSPMVVITEASERGNYSTLAPYQQSRGDYGGLELPKILDAITKEHWFPRTPSETIRSVQLAFKHATATRPGPTAVILDGDAITSEFNSDVTPPVWSSKQQVQNWQSQPSDDDLELAAESLTEAKRPVIIAGNGIHSAKAYDELVAVAESYGCAITTSYLGKSTIPETHDLAAGVIGSFGHEGANQLVADADVLLVVGCRLNPMDTNWQAESFIRPQDQTIIHADIKTENAGWVYPADVGLIGDAMETLSALSKQGVTDGATSKDWALKRAHEARRCFVPDLSSGHREPMRPQRAVKMIEQYTNSNTIVTADSGNNRFWLLHYLQTSGVGTYFGSGGVGGMGWAVPAAVSAALTTDKRVIGVTGDGGFAMTMTSLETAVDHGVAPVIVILNDASLGMVRQMQSEGSTISGVEFPDSDFVTIAKGLGTKATRVQTPDSLGDALEDAVNSNSPTVIDAHIDREEQMEDTLQSSFYEEVGGLHE